MNVSGHKNLLVWQKSMDLVTEVYSITKKFPKEETYSLTSQIRRAAVSIPSNLAEGHAMKSTAHYIKFVYIARGSLAELETQMTIAGNLQYISDKELRPILVGVEDLGRMLSKLIYGLYKKIDQEDIYKNLIPIDSLSSNP